MKRIRIVLIIMAVLVAAAVGVYFTAGHISNKNKKEAEQKANELVIFDFDSNDSTDLKIHNQGGDYEMHYTIEDNWQMTGEVDFEANSYTATYICSVMAGLTAERIINTDDISKFGFDDPITLTVTANGKDYTLHVGDISPTNESFYVMKEGSDNIYLISYQNGIVLCATKDTLKNQYLVNMSSSRIEHFAFWKGSESDDNILFFMDKDSDGMWSMKKPYTDMMIFNSYITEYLDTITSDMIGSFIEEHCPESNYSKYGFDSPSYVFEISDGENFKKIIFGDETNNDADIYALYTGSGQVVTFEKKAISLLKYTTVDMMNQTVYQKKVEEIHSLNVKTSDFEVTAELDSANDQYKLNDTEISSGDSDTFSVYFAFLDAVNDAYFSEINRKISPDGEAEVTVTYVLADGTETVIEYVPGAGDDSDSYWTFIDGKYSGFIVKNKVIQNIISKYNELEKVVK